MAHPERSSGLRTIFSFFLGLMLTAFVGIGVYTFHPQPTQFDDRMQELGRQDREVRNAKAQSELTAEDRSQLQEIERRQDELSEAAEDARKKWGISTSIILIVFATLVMIASLVRADQLPVISNGLLLGGVFTMLYGIGWVVASDTSLTRFLIMTAALVITIGLGYLRFVRRGTVSAVPSGPDIPVGEDLADLERRIRHIEGRLGDAAHALGKNRDGSEAS